MVDMFTNGGLMAKHFCLINGDFSRMDDIIRLIAAYKVDCLLVYPVWPKVWRGAIDLLPTVWGPYTLPTSPRLCTPGPRVRAAHLDGPRYPLHAAIIWWGVRAQARGLR